MMSKSPNKVGEGLLSTASSSKMHRNVCTLFAPRITQCEADKHRPQPWRADDCQQQTIAASVVMRVSNDMVRICRNAHLSIMLRGYLLQSIRRLLEPELNACHSSKTRAPRCQSSQLYVHKPSSSYSPIVAAFILQSSFSDQKLRSELSDYFLPNPRKPPFFSTFFLGNAFPVTKLM